MPLTRFTAIHPKLNVRQQCIVDSGKFKFADGTRVSGFKIKGLLPVDED